MTTASWLGITPANWCIFSDTPRTAEYVRFATHYRFRPDFCEAADPESKGIVERRNGFFETSFMPGRHFESPADFNAQFTDWLTTANARVVRTIKARPSELLAADKEAMLPLPPAQAFHCAASESFHSTYVHLLAGMALVTERSVPSLSSMPTATLIPLPPT